MRGDHVQLSFRDIDNAILKANGIIEKGKSVANIQKEAKSPKIDLFSIIEVKVGKLVEAKLRVYWVLKA
jgi:hypothetical protein